MIKSLFSRMWRRNYIEYKLHPKNDKAIESAGFKIDGEKYYRFKNENDIRYGRFLHLSKFITEFQMKLTQPELIEHINDALNLMNTGKNTEAGAILVSLRSKARLIFEEDTMYRLASGVFFPLSENINEYDYDYNSIKMDKFKKLGLEDFFLKTPIKEYFPVNSISEKDLTTFIQKETNRVKIIESVLLEIKSAEQLRRKKE